MSRVDTSQLGERVAEQHLVKLGHRIVTRNFRCPYGEIDLITEDAGELVFVEVRTRRSTAFGSPEESITPTKQARMARCAMTYLSSHPAPRWRIDVVAIQLESSRVTRLDHYKHALE